MCFITFLVIQRINSTLCEKLFSFLLLKLFQWSLVAFTTELTLLIFKSWLNNLARSYVWSQPIPCPSEFREQVGDKMEFVGWDKYLLRQKRKMEQVCNDKNICIATSCCCSIKTVVLPCWVAWAALGCAPIIREQSQHECADNIVLPEI